MKNLFCVCIIFAVLFQCSLGKKNSLKPSEKWVVNKRIVGGQNANNKYTKGAVLILYTDADGNDVQKCTGTMLDRRYVLSAANCFVDSSGEPTGNSFAQWKIVPSTKFTDSGEAQIKVKTIFIHSKFKGTDYRFNVAVLFLEKGIPLRKFKKVKIVNPPRDKSTVKAVGYGKIDDAKVDSERLLMTDLVYRKFSWCNNRQKTAVTITLSSSRNVCAVSLNYPVGETGVCEGDEGGPLYKINSGDNLQQFGLYSFSSWGCGAYNAIPWFTRIRSFGGAINRIVKSGSDSKFISFDGDRTSFSA